MQPAFGCAYGKRTELRSVEESGIEAAELRGNIAEITVRLGTDQINLGQARDGSIVAGAEAVTMLVANTGDRPVQVGSHYHFAETNPALAFDRAEADGLRLDLPAGTAMRFEPGQMREVRLVPFGGLRRVYGFNGQVMGDL